MRSSPRPATKITDGSTVEVKYARQVTATIDGNTTSFWTTATTLADALDELGLHDPAARLSVDRSMPWTRRADLQRDHPQGHDGDRRRRHPHPAEHRG